MAELSMGEPAEARQDRVLVTAAVESGTKPIRPFSEPGRNPSTGGPPRRWRHRRRVSLLLLLSGPVVLALVVLAAPAWLRAVPVLTYLAVVPGLAGVRLLRLADRLMEILLGVGLSCTLGILVAQAMIYLRAWSPTLGLSTLVVIGSLAAGLELYRGQRSGGAGDRS
jgi:hypothetical protein